jgi:predicted NUDIX family NTP pyrophosphohydrolase
MAVTSAGLLMCRVRGGEIEFLLVHPGGPFWKNKEAGAWTIPKGEIGSGEEPLQTAKREFREELGLEPVGDFVELPAITQKGGKRVLAWAFQGDCDPDRITSNTFEIEWPPRSGRMARFPEVDRAGFFNWEAACERMNPAQWPLLRAAAAKLRRDA